ncbi:DUF4304 domain-containing protein [Lacrimispora sp. BS-2]|uniref:DUF4304 domain-containing protein n=1 Tax=Lacrimispora sp. BS-2 TaxID=3151850 RepID=A0AAU7PR09_9FIRM
MERDWDKNSNELKALREQSQDMRLEYYFKAAAQPNGPSAEKLREMLDITEEDGREYQIRKEKEVNMKPVKKRDCVVREVVKPLLKASGFKTRRQDWWKELEDSWLLIHMQYSQWNSSLTGACFGFYISVTAKADIRTEIAEQWIYNRVEDLNQFDFLPHWGLLSPYCSGDMYKIDGYQNYLPTDEPVKNILAQIRGDFEDYVIPALLDVHNIDEWKLLYQRKKNRYAQKENYILRFFSIAILMQSAVEWPRWQEKYGLTQEDILAHLDWLAIMEQHSAFPDGDMRSRIVRYFTPADSD